VALKHTREEVDVTWLNAEINTIVWNEAAFFYGYFVLWKPQKMLILNWHCELALAKRQRRYAQASPQDQLHQ